MADIREMGSKDDAAQLMYARLAGTHGQPCVSVYTASFLSAIPAKADLDRLTRLVRSACERFADASLTPDAAEELLKSCWYLLPSGNAVRAGTRALAVFLSDGFFECFQLPSPAAEFAVVGHEFHVRPLLAIVPEDDRFFLLAVSQKHVKLFQGSYSGLTERTVEAVPENLHEDLSGRSFEKAYQSHTAASPLSHTKGAVFHGSHFNKKEEILHFLRSVDRGIANSLKDHRAPLIVAAVDYLFPIYKEANTYPHLADSAIVGSPDLLSTNALHAAAWKVVEEQASKARNSAFALYGEHVNTPLTSSNLRDVVLAASRGLVRFLFIPESGDRWGSIAQPDTVHLHASQEMGDDELLNLAAVLTLRHQGSVYVIPRAQLREGADAAALFRFGLGSHAASAT